MTQFLWQMGTGSCVSVGPTWPGLVERIRCGHCVLQEAKEEDMRLIWEVVRDVELVRVDIFVIKCWRHILFRCMFSVQSRILIGWPHSSRRPHIGTVEKLSLPMLLVILEFGSRVIQTLSVFLLNSLISPARPSSESRKCHSEQCCAEFCNWDPESCESRQKKSR